MEYKRYDENSEAVGTEELWNMVENVKSARSGEFTDDSPSLINLSRDTDGKLVRMANGEKLYANTFNEKEDAIKQGNPDYTEATKSGFLGRYILINKKINAESGTCTLYILGNTSSDSTHRTGSKKHIFEIEFADNGISADKLIGMAKTNPMVIRSFVERVFSAGKPNPGETLKTFLNPNMEGDGFGPEYPNPKGTMLPPKRDYFGLSPFRYLSTARLFISE